MQIISARGFDGPKITDTFWLQNEDEPFLQIKSSSVSMNWMVPPASGDKRGSPGAFSPSEGGGSWCGLGSPGKERRN